MGEKQSILIVDDDESTRRTLTLTLGDKGYETEPAGTGREALGKVEKRAFDGALIDIKLPDMDGTALLEAFKKGNPEMVCIMVTDHASVPNGVEALHKDANGYFVKPLAIEDVVQRVEDALHKERLQQELNDSEERYSSLVETLTDAIISIDEKGEIIQWNAAASKVFDYLKDEVIGKPIDILIPEKYRRSHIEGFKRFLETKSNKVIGKTIEMEGLRSDGTVVPIELSLSAGQKKGSWIFTGVIRNISERKRAEEQREKLQAQLRQAQKMEAIGTLAGGIAHDFNNILSAIIGYTELELMDDASKGDQSHANLQEVLKAGHRAKELVKQILAFSRQSEQERKPIQISPVIKEALKMLRASLPSTIEIRPNIQADTGIIEADPTQIYQVIMNLCANAARTMSERGGILEISLANVELDSVSKTQYPEIDPGPYLRLTVSDTGAGMTPEVLERIFDPYSTTKGAGEGIGLGLTVVHGIVKSHGGAITVYSEPGKGSTFHAYFPVIQREASSKAETVELLPTGNECILFIDDEPALVEMCRYMLERLGYKVVTRTSGIEALELFRTKPDEFDLVITDMTMPQMTGDELAGKLIRIRPDIPIILCTGFNEGITEEKAKAIGIREFVMKPILIGEIAKSIRRVLD